MDFQLPSESRFSIYDIQDFEEVLADRKNFKAESDVNVFEVINTKGTWEDNVRDKSLSNKISNFHSHQADAGRRLLAIFVSLKYDKSLKYTHQASISHRHAERLMEYRYLHPGFFCNLTGRVDYWAPGVFYHSDYTVYYCQHPRWNIANAVAPCSVYMYINKSDHKVLYFVTTGEKDNINQLMRREMIDFLIYHASKPTLQIPIVDPFYLHSRIALLIFNQSKPVMSDVRTYLYIQLDILNKLPTVLPTEQRVAAAIRERLSKTTRELNVVSQNADSLMSSEERSIRVSNSLLSNYRIEKDITKRDDTETYTARQAFESECEDHLQYLVSAIDLQSSWLKSYKWRKDTAMNLVYNMSMQLDSLTNVDMSRDMKNDSSSMHAIASLTMIFLPATAVATIFGSDIFFGGLKISALIAYIVITVILTLGSLLLWAYNPNLFNKLKGKLPRSFGRPKRKDIEQNHYGSKHEPKDDVPPVYRILKQNMSVEVEEE